MGIPKNTGYYIDMLTDISVCSDVIESSLMCNKTRQKFQDLLESAKTNDEDLDKLVTELSQWLQRHQPQTFGV